MQRIKNDIQKVKRLINIARPAELPPLKPNNQTELGASQSTKKINLPLFGKKKMFGFDKLKMQASNQKAESSGENKKDHGESIEEFDDEDGGGDPKPTKENADEIIGDEKSESNPLSQKETKSCDEKTIESTSKTTSETLAKQKEATSPELSGEKMTTEEKPKNTTNQGKPHASATEISKSNISSREIANDESTVENNLNTNASNKNRSKNRNRSNKMRYQVDIDDTEEDLSPQKYSGWIPPVNQTGDGMTDLNSKYGY